MNDTPDIIKTLRDEESKAKLRGSFLKLKPSEHAPYEEINKKEPTLKHSIDAKRTFQTLINMISDPVVVVDKKGRFLEVSDRIEELTGVRREQLLETNFMKTKFITAKSKAILIKNFAKRMLGEKLEKYEIEAISKNGEIIPFEINGVKIDYNGKPADLVVLQDISTPKKTAEALKTSEQKWRHLFENIPDVIMTVDCDGKILAINHTIKGLNVEDVIGKSLSEFESPKHQHIRKKSLEKVLQTGKPQTYEILGMGQDGQLTAWYETRVILINPKKKNESLVLISRDITDRRMTEQKLKEKLEELKKFQDVTVDRELQMIELKKEINELCEKYGEKPRYDINLKNEIEINNL